MTYTSLLGNANTPLSIADWLKAHIKGSLTDKRFVFGIEHVTHIPMSEVSHALC